MTFDNIIVELSIIFVSAATLGTIFLYAKQPVIIAYIVAGILLGPNGFALIKQTEHIEKISHLGIILLLFIVGLNLHPNKLIKYFKKTAVLTCLTSGLFGGAAFFVAKMMGLDVKNSVIFAAAMMFSSTVVSLKLIPTTVLHHKRTGEIMTSVLLLQDLLAILTILFITGERGSNVSLTFFILTGKLALLCLAAFAGVKFITIPLLKKFDVVQEYTFLITLGWCLLWAELARMFGLSYEIGAFVAGLSIASNRVAIIIAEHLKPLREFFLILFFFAIGASMNFKVSPMLLLSAVCFGIILVPIKFIIFRTAFKKTGEEKSSSTELSFRLAQASEFSLLVAASALSVGILSKDCATMINITTIVTFIFSTYLVVKKYPTPIAGSPSLRQD